MRIHDLVFIQDSMLIDILPSIYFCLQSDIPFYNCF